VVGGKWAAKELAAYKGLRNLSVVGGGTNTLHGVLVNSVFQANGVLEHVHITQFAGSGAVGLGLANVQDITFRDVKTNGCTVGLQLAPKPTGLPGANTNLLFENYVGQSNTSWSIDAPAGGGGADNITFVGGVSQSQGGYGANLNGVSQISFTGHYFEGIGHHEVAIG
jgi:hypothetical protein